MHILLVNVYNSLLGDCYIALIVSILDPLKGYIYCSGAIDTKISSWRELAIDRRKNLLPKRTHFPPSFFVLILYMRNKLTFSKEYIHIFMKHVTIQGHCYNTCIYKIYLLWGIFRICIPTNIFQHNNSLSPNIF